MTEFEQGLQADGYTEIATRSLAAHHATTPHAHDFTIRALVLRGDITLTVDGQATRYCAGEVFTMAAGRAHTEQVGADGVTTVSGRRYG